MPYSGAPPATNARIWGPVLLPGRLSTVLRGAGRPPGARRWQARTASTCKPETLMPRPEFLFGGRASQQRNAGHNAQQHGILLAPCRPSNRCVGGAGLDWHGRGSSRVPHSWSGSGKP